MDSLITLELENVEVLMSGTDAVVGGLDPDGDETLDVGLEAEPDCVVELAPVCGLPVSEAVELGPG